MANTNDFPVVLLKITYWDRKIFCWRHLFPDQKLIVDRLQVRWKHNHFEIEMEEVFWHEKNVSSSFATHPSCFKQIVQDPNEEEWAWVDWLAWFPFKSKSKKKKICKKKKKNLEQKYSSVKIITTSNVFLFLSLVFNLSWIWTSYFLTTFRRNFFPKKLFKKTFVSNKVLFDKNNYS